MIKIVSYAKRIMHFGNLYKDFLIGDDITTFMTNIETMLIKSKYDWQMVYNPTEKTYYFKVRRS